MELCNNQYEISRRIISKEMEENLPISLLDEIKKDRLKEIKEGNSIFSKFIKSET